VTPAGNIARIYNATASGAVHLFCYNGNVLPDPLALDGFRRYVPMLRRRWPRVEAAVYLPKTSWALEPGCQHRIFELAHKLRDAADVEFLDPLTIDTPLARGVRVLAIAEAPYVEQTEIDALRRWVAAGGILVAAVNPDRRILLTPEGSDRGRDALLAVPPAEGFLRLSPQGPPPKHFRVHFGTPGDEEYIWGGWHVPERTGRLSPADGPGLRWTEAKAGISVPCDPAEDATLVLVGCLREKPKPGTTRVLVNGVAVGEFDKPGLQRFRFAVPKAALAGQSVAEVMIEAPAAHGDVPGDTWLRGGMFAVAEMFSRGAEHDPPATPALVRQFDWSRAAPCVRHLGKGATLALPCRNAKDLGVAVVETLAHPERLGLAGKGVALPSADADGVFATRTTDGVLYYNANGEPRTVDGVEVPADGIAWKGMNP
jgi:hypothetical protein